MLEKELAHHAARQEVGRCRTLGRESEEIYRSFGTQGRRHQKTETGISVTPQKDSCPKYF